MQAKSQGAPAPHVFVVEPRSAVVEDSGEVGSNSEEESQASVGGLSAWASAATVNILISLQRMYPFPLSKILDNSVSTNTPAFLHISKPKACYNVKDDYL